MGDHAIPELDVAGLSASYEARIADAAPELLPLALRTLARVAPGQWTLEWYLPWWLGHAFGLPYEMSRAIVLSNVLGLASLRLQDDLVDGEVAAGEQTSAEALAAVLYRQAVDGYRGLFGDSALFWGRLDAFMDDWRSATSGARPGAAVPLRAGDDLLLHLARRGAPLRISAFAICLLADREDRSRIVDRCLDHTLAAMVLYDHFVDWEDDVAAGRWNAFVAAGGGTRRAVLVAMLAHGAITTHFARIDAELLRAIEAAGQLGSVPLVAHLRRYTVRIQQQGAQLQSHHGHLADVATALLGGHHRLGRTKGGSVG